MPTVDILLFCLLPFLRHNVWLFHNFFFSLASRFIFLQTVIICVCVCICKSAFI